MRSGPRARAARARASASAPREPPPRAAQSGLRPGFIAHKDQKESTSLHVRISQETFDQAVQENIDDFGMEPEEALEDAARQFESQGANLSNILRRVPGAAEDEPAVLRVVARMKALLEEAEDEETVELNFGTGALKISFGTVGPTQGAALSEAAAELRAEVQRDKLNATFAGHNGGVDALVSASLSLLRSPSALAPVLEALATMVMDAENREQLDARGVAAIAVIMNTHIDGADAIDALRAAMHAARAAMLVHERHRQMFVGSAGLLPLVVRAMRDHPDDAPTMLAACGAVRATTLSDDMRSRVSKGHDHAKAAVELGVLPLLLAALRNPMARHAPTCAELLATLSRVTVTDQICAQLASMDALPLAIGELGNNMTDAQVARQACFFLANISGNDGCKGSIVAGHGHVAIVQAMLLHPNHAGLQMDAVAALGNMALRMPANCEAIAEAGGVPAIVAAFGQHINQPRMQSKACLAVRNLVGRNEELRGPLLEQGVENLLRSVLAAHEDGYVHNLAKAALRDLHCSVHLAEGFKGEIGKSHTIEQGEADTENHWDKFLDTPAAQEAIKREMAELS